MKAIKRIVKQIFCKHDYWLYGIFTMGGRDHEYKDMMCRCSKCGKEKSYKFKKELDKFKELWYNKYVIKGASAPKKGIETNEKC